jgi:hypothetical protein
VQVGHFGRCWDVDRSRRRRVVTARQTRMRSAVLMVNAWRAPTPAERTMSQSPQTSERRNFVGYGFLVKLSSHARNMRVENKDAIGFVHRACGSGLPRFDDRQVVAGIFAPCRIELLR